MKIHILGPAPDRFGLQTVGDYLKTVLRRVKSGGTVKIAVAYAQESGWLSLQPILSSILKKKNIVVECIWGIDDQGTSEKAVQSAVRLLGVPHVFLFHNPADATFHVKFFLVQLNPHEGVIIIGSSNITESGLLLNFELNIALELDLSQKMDCNYFSRFNDLFEQMRTAPSSLPASQNLLRELSQAKAFTGTIVSEWSRSFGNIRQGIQNLFPRTAQRGRRRRARFVTTPRRPRSFVMTLAYNDVSGKRGEPYILIPLGARDQFTHFWGWPKLFKQGRKYMERRFQVKVHLPRHTHTELKRRLYYVPERSEFRLTCETIYRQLGSSHIGSITKIRWKRASLCEIAVISPGGPNYANLIKKCQPLFQGKRWGYV